MNGRISDSKYTEMQTTNVRYVDRLIGAFTAMKFGYLMIEGEYSIWADLSAAASFATMSTILEELL